MVNEVDYDGGWLQFKGLHVGGGGGVHNCQVFKNVRCEIFSIF